MNGTKTSTFWYENPEIWNQVDNNPKSIVGTRTPCLSSRTGNELPRHAQLIRDGGNATTALSAFQESVVLDRKFDTVYGVLNDNRLFKDHYLGWQLAPFRNPLTTVSASDIAKAQAQARTYAFNKINKLQAPFQSQAFLGELRETLQLVRHPTESLKKLTFDFAKVTLAIRRQLNNYAEGHRKFPTREFERLVRSASNAWLEYRFGALPLVYDINNLVGIAARLAEIDAREKNRTYGKVESSTTTVEPSVALNGTGIRVRRETTKINTAECFIHFGVRLEKLIDLESFHVRLEQSATDLRQIPLTAWELTPFSWVVDYFVNVQDVLASTLTSQTAVSYSSESTVLTCTDVVMISNVHGVKSAVVSGPLPYTVVKRRNVSRVGGSLAIPPVTFTLPGSNTKFMNLAALFGQLKSNLSKG